MTLTTRALSVQLGRKPILRDVNLTASPGDITMIIGPNGSGKSTLLRALTGELPHHGDIRLNDRPLRSYKPWDLADTRGVLQQAQTVAFPFTVREIVSLGHASGRAATDPTVPAQALAKVDLAGFGDRYYQELSGGEQQRAQLARVLAQIWPHTSREVPPWLFLDEPVSSLDFGHQQVVMDLMRDFASAGGGTVAVMHDLNLTAIHADHVILMKAGQVLASGPVRDTLTEALLSEAYGCPVRVSGPVPDDLPYILPQSAL